MNDEIRNYDPTMKTVFVSGPYGDLGTTLQRVIKENRRNARIARNALMERGYAVITPHEMFEHLLEDYTQAEIDEKFPPQYFYAACLAILKQCDGIYLVHGWDDSFGAREQRAAAIRWGKEIIPYKRPI